LPGTREQRECGPATSVAGWTWSASRRLWLSTYRTSAIPLLETQPKGVDQESNRGQTDQWLERREIRQRTAHAEGGDDAFVADGTCHRWQGLRNRWWQLPPRRVSWPVPTAGGRRLQCNKGEVL